MFGYNKIGHQPILFPRTGTYFQLLPTELWVKINDYFFGPLEIRLEQYGNDIAYFVLDKYIRSETSIDLLENSVNFAIPIAELTKNHDINSEQGLFRNDRFTISWGGDHTLIQYYPFRLYLHDNLSRLFWIKIAQLDDIIGNAILTNNESSLKNIRI